MMAPYNATPRRLWSLRLRALWLRASRPRYWRLSPEAQAKRAWEKRREP